MRRSSYYLLALFLSFIASFLWVSSRTKTSMPTLTLAYGSCPCPDDANDSTTSFSPISKSSSLLKGITVASPSHVPLQPTFQPNRLYYLPFTPSHQVVRTPFPSKLWQKAGPNGIDKDRQNGIKSWQMQNPSLRHEILTDGSAEQYVRDQFSRFPKVIDTYQDLQVPILKADFLRHFLLHADGGVWSDLDVTCHKPIDSWIPAKYKDQTNLAVGLEFDGNQFASWTVMAKPGTNHIAAVNEYIIDTLEEEANRANTIVAGLTMKTISDVVLVTGPQAMTRAILKSVPVELGETVGGKNVSNLHEPVLLHDVLVFPNAAFAAMQGGWPQDQGPYLVEHHYAGSWKKDHGGESVSNSRLKQDGVQDSDAQT